MIRVDIGESFIVSVALWNEVTESNSSGRTVYYDVRDDNDAVLSPTVSGVLTESTVTSGIYFKELSIDTPGNYIFYATCSDFFSSSEEIIINPENIYDLVKQNRHYNISSEEVIRTNGSATPSQTARSVELLRTDYIITRIKGNSDADWGSTTVSGVVYAWYKTLGDDLPYKMASSGV